MNAFSKEERVAFDQVILGFEDYLVLSKNVSKYQTSGTDMERSNDTIWRPQPYIAQSYDGLDQTGNFNAATQLSVPATLGFLKSSPWVMDAKELRDALQSDRLGEAAKQKLASDINIAIMNVVTNQSSLVVAQPGAATGFDDVALCDSIMNEQGVPMIDRYLALSSRDYNSMAGNLAARQTLTGKPLTAYEKAYVGQVSSFETYKLDYANRLTAAVATGITMDTQVGAVNYYTPRATSTAAGTGETSNVDNRFQTITVSSTTGIKAGDAFTIAGVEAVHHITKEPTGQLKTFRVISVESGTTLKITAPIVSGQGGTDAELRYKNVEVTGVASAAIVFLNTVTAAANPFWVKDAIEILPGSLSVDSGAGVGVMRATLENGIEVVMTKQWDVQLMKNLYRMDVLFGVVNKQPEMSGILLFGQV